MESTIKLFLLTFTHRTIAANVTWPIPPHLLSLSLLDQTAQTCSRSWSDVKQMKVAISC